MSSNFNREIFFDSKLVFFYRKAPVLSFSFALDMWIENVHYN